MTTSKADKRRANFIARLEKEAVIFRKIAESDIDGLCEYLAYPRKNVRDFALQRLEDLKDTMFRYPDIYRIPVKGYERRGKKYLTINEVRELLDGVVEVEEKIDGKRMQVHIEDYTIFKENCKRQHTITYKSLPAWEIGFDIWVGEKFLPREEKKEIFDILDIPMAPALLWGKFISLDPILDLIGQPSTFGAERIEGIVIKNPEKQLFGKLVDPLFDQEVDESEHHLRRPYVMNRLDLSKMYSAGG